MGESDDHRKEMNDYAINVLKDCFRSDPMVYVSGNNFLYYTEGVPADCVSPDTYVVKGVSCVSRDIFKVWEEGGHVPCFVLEVTSKSTKLEDLGTKMARYRDDLGVPEYFLFDPRKDWVKGRLQGYRLDAGMYKLIEPGPSERLASRELGLELGVESSHVRFYLPGAVDPLPTFEERAYRAEEEARRLREELETLRQARPGT